jgi:predicted PurR-regulated permease PerM
VVQITSGMITMVKAVLNFIIGIIVTAYVLMIQEQLLGQSKKLLFAVFKPAWANVIIETVHKADEILGGFITGKLIDSAIIGVICYIGCVILHIPDSMLVAVIIGVTNIIPVFGPFIGAVPALILVAIQSPWHALYLLIFIVILQQVDGNILGPKILGNSTGLSAFWVMFAILIGSAMFGFAGMLLGVPVFAMIYYIVRRLVNYGVRGRGLPTETKEYVAVSGVDAATGKFSYYEEETAEEKES